MSEHPNLAAGEGGRERVSERSAREQGRQTLAVCRTSHKTWSVGHILIGGSPGRAVDSIIIQFRYAVCRSPRSGNWAAASLVSDKLSVLAFILVSFSIEGFQRLSGRLRPPPSGEVGLLRIDCFFLDQYLHPASARCGSDPDGTPSQSS